MTQRRKLGVGVIGFGWLGQAHSRSLLRAPTLFAARGYDPVLVSCADPLPARREQATQSFGFRRATPDWQAVIGDPQVDLVYVAAPNMLHVEAVQAAAAAGKPVFCEKPVGGRPPDVLRAAKAASAAGIVNGVGYNYRWAPLVRYAHELLSAGALGEITNYRGRFFSMYGADPLGVNSWRFQIDEGGYGVTSDLLSHAVDMALMLAGPIVSVTGTIHTYITERPMPTTDSSHYGRGDAEDPMLSVTNEDYAAMLVVFRNGARGTFESSRTIVGPESQMAFDVHGTDGALGWNLERLNELRLYRRQSDRSTGYTTILGGDRFGHHGAFVPGAGNSIGFEDMVAIEDHEFCSAVSEGRAFTPSLVDALAAAEVQDALLRSARSGHWEDVLPLVPDPEERVA